MKTQKILFAILITVAFLMVGCENSKEVLSPVNSENSLLSNSNDDLSKTSDLDLYSPGAVYTMTNSVDGNEIVAFERSVNGTLTLSGHYSTKGAGSGGEIDPLDSQGSVILSKLGNAPTSAKHWLFAVNAGSNEISSFLIEGGKLDLKDVVDSGGEFPVSVTVYGNLLYVLNARGSNNIDVAQKYNNGNIVGFHILRDGRLRMINGSRRFLNVKEEVAPAQIRFSPDGKLLIVTDKITSSIYIFLVSENGLTKGPISHHSAGETPFGFAFDRRGHLIVSEAFRSSNNAGAVSLYEVGLMGELQVISSSVRTGQTAGCWTVVTRDGRFSYVSNTISGTISAFGIESGGLKLLHDDGIAVKIGENSFPIDMALSQDSGFLYVLNAGLGRIGAYAIQSNGDLSPLSDSSELPGHLPANAGVQGLAAY